MILYLNCDLVKGSPKPGSYVGRVQTGTSADGSPIYKYFYDAKEYEGYLSRKRQGDVAGKREDSAEAAQEPQAENDKAAGASPGKLKAKVQEEHERSKQKAAPPSSKPASVQKSLYVGIDQHYFYVKE